MTDPNEVEISVPENDYEGSLEKFQIQTGSRVKIPDDWLSFLGLEEGDSVVVACKEDSVVIKEWNRENLKEL